MAAFVSKHTVSKPPQSDDAEKHHW